MTDFEKKLLEEAAGDEEYGEIVVIEKRASARYQIALSLSDRGLLTHVDTIGGTEIPEHLFAITQLGKALISKGA